MSEEQATTTVTDATNLDLAQPRVLAFQDAHKRPYAITCRRVAERDWTKYFSGMMFTSEMKDGEMLNSRNIYPTMLELADAVITEAEGYTVTGGQPLSSLPNWKQRLPLQHRVLVGQLLTDAEVANNDDCEIHPEGEAVTLHSTWSRGDAGTMTKFLALKHVLATPSAEHFRRYSSVASRSRVVGGSRSGKTIYQGAQATLIALYDELVVSVEGYTVNGVPLDGKDIIVREMDAYHKFIAAQEIFDSQRGLEVMKPAEE